MSSPADEILCSPEQPGAARVQALDALRGLAVAGIALMNVIAFSMPGAAYVNPRAFGGSGLADIAGWALVFVTVEDKFRALFAMLFGAGVAILLASPRGGGLGGHFARMAVLFAIGLLHAALLASNDILRVYAVAGLVLPLVAHLRPRVLFAMAGALVLGQLLVSAWYYADYLAAWLRADRAALARMEYLFGSAPESIAAALERGREGFAERLARRWANEPAYTLRVMAGLPSSLAAMLSGMGLWRGGLLRGEWDRARALRLFAWTGLPALLVLGAMALSAAASGFDALVTASIALVWSAPFDLLLAVGWAGIAMTAFAGGNAVTRLLAAAGRMALTNYLLTSLVFALMFASWGLGLFGMVGRAQAYALALVPVTLMLTVSPLWLAHFRQGPAEWAWRSLARWRILPLRPAEPEDRGQRRCASG